MHKDFYEKIKQIFPYEAFERWFLQNRRDFPWRRDPTPYKVWISEVMLQQTRASVVVFYFERWMALFPDVSTLAKASFTKVLKAWEGLGYYQRVRNLHLCAKKIYKDFQGKIPDNETDLQSLPGLGPYTRGALLAFGFKKRSAAVDANAMRAMARYFLIEENISKEKTKKEMFALQEKILPKKDPHILVEAWIELGSTVCSSIPKCTRCPLAKECLAHRQKKEVALPILAKRKEITELKRVVLVVENNGSFLLQKRGKKELMGDLFEFPYFELQKGKISKRKIASWALLDLGIGIHQIRALDVEKQSFTLFRATLFPFFAISHSSSVHPSYQWVEKTFLGMLSFSAGHRRILQKVLAR